MKIRLLKAARIPHAAGETVEASPDVVRFLVAVGSAEIVKDAPKKRPRRKAETETETENKE